MVKAPDAYRRALKKVPVFGKTNKKQPVTVLLSSFQTDRF